jgi:hypothetical protein
VISFGTSAAAFQRSLDSFRRSVAALLPEELLELLDQLITTG